MVPAEDMKEAAVRLKISGVKMAILDSSVRIRRVVCGIEDFWPGRGSGHFLEAPHQPLDHDLQIAVSERRNALLLVEAVACSICVAAHEVHLKQGNLCQHCLQEIPCHRGFFPRVLVVHVVDTHPAG